MSSEISGSVKPEFNGKGGKYHEKLLPAGSILGAPKPKTLEIILNAEGYERDITREFAAGLMEKMLTVV
jgi:para-aminobenzoate synthetase component 1